MPSLPSSHDLDEVLSRFGLIAPAPIATELSAQTAPRPRHKRSGSREESAPAEREDSHPPDSTDILDKVGSLIHDQESGTLQVSVWEPPHQSSQDAGAE